MIIELHNRCIKIYTFVS